MRVSRKVEFLHCIVSLTFVSRWQRLVNLAGTSSG